MADTIDVTTPSVNRISGGAMDYGTGLAGGIVYELASRYVGRGLIGAAIATAIAATVLKPSKAEIVATMAGFQAAQDSPLVFGMIDRLPGQQLLDFNI